MSKRLTVTEKWQDVWFQDLEPLPKLMFVYICDNCDCAGFWEINYRLAAYQTRIEQNSIETVMQQLSNSYLTDGKFVWLKNFMKHQGYLQLSPKHPVRQGCTKRIMERNSFGKQVVTFLKKNFEFEVLSNS